VTGPVLTGTPVRRAYIDWLRGFAVLFMVLWHTVDSWHVDADRQTAAFGVVIFFAGWAAPMFLFLAGVSLPMAGLSRLARGQGRQAASRALQWRGLQVLFIAHLFRLQSFLLNPHATWDVLFMPDILNVLGLGLVLAAFGWGRGPTTRAGIIWLLVPAVAIAAVLTPWIPTWWWPSLLHPRLEGYVRVVNNNAVFSLFPAVAYVFAGTFVGMVLAERAGREERRFHAAASLWGGALLAIAVAAAYVPWPPPIAAWTGTLWIVTGRVAAMLLMLSAAWWLLLRHRPNASGLLMVFGRTSLFVYFIHVELVYGTMSYPLQRSLPLPWALSAYALLTMALYGAARLWLRRRGQPLVPAHLVARPETVPIVATTPGGRATRIGRL
jgi:uncharacterized membrane protein